MRAYGYKRRDKLTCKYGCCVSNKNTDKVVCSKRAKKRSRAEGKADIHSSLTDDK